MAQNKNTHHEVSRMTGRKSALIGALLGAIMLSGCETTSAVFDGVGGVFMGAGQDVRRIGGH